MRWGLIVVMLLFQLAAPLSGSVVQAEAAQAREQSAEIIGLNEVVVHRNELIEISFAVQNTGSEVQIFTIEATDVPSDLSISGLPLTHSIEPGYLKSLKFNLSGDATATYGTLNIPISLTMESNSTWSVEENLSVLVAPYSRLDFGVQGISTFESDPGIRTSVAVNITNNGSYPEDVTFNFYTQSGWNWGWSMNDSDGVNAYETLQPGQLAYVYIWVDVPEVVDGSPLTGTGPRFQLKAVSSIDRAISQWSFDLILGTYRNASIDAKGPDLILDPGANNRIEVDVRNVGNSNNRLNITLQAIDTEGQPIPDVGLSDRIARNGWTMALFGGLEDVELSPNESRTIEIGFQAPSDYFGAMDVRVRVFAEGAPQRVRTVDVGAVIEWQRNATAALQTDECRDLLPNASCQAALMIQNTGNAPDTFTIDLSDVPDHLSASLLTTTVYLNPFESKTFAAVSITAAEESLAFTTGDVGLQVLLSGTSTVIEEIAIPTKIAPVINWVFTDIVEEIDKNGRLTITMTARNEGNAIDGLLVQLQASHSTPMSFIPPFIAVYEEGVEYPRSFEITEIPIGFNFTIEAWVDLPQDQRSNGTVYVNTTVRSQFVPDEPFVHTSTGTYLGVAWQPVEEESGWFDLTAIVDATVGIFMAWMWVIGSVCLSVFIIQKALSARKARAQEQALYNELHGLKPTEEPQDWMQKFTEKKVQPAPEPTLKVSSGHFQEAFINRSGAPTQALEPVQAEVHQAAAQALDEQDRQRTMAQADRLLNDISAGNIAQPVGSKEVLPDVEIPQHLTVRHDPKSILDQAPLTSQQPKVPLPNATGDLDLDELDV
ncbi:MAG: hypothetical protein DWC04_06950 [Candidatus Poseidoniales archaeon]|nr:MAG: hypothetical protein DWC04_06950 [Candidatus Poseidoniales archaeon]